MDVWPLGVVKKQGDDLLAALFQINEYFLKRKPFPNREVIRESTEISLRKKYDCSNIFFHSFSFKKHTTTTEIIIR